MNIRELITRKNNEYLNLIDQKNKITKETESQINEIKIKIEEIEDDSDRAVSKVKRDYAKKIDDLQNVQNSGAQTYREEGLQRIRKIENDHAERRSEIVKEYNSRVSEINSQYELKMQKLERSRKRELDQLKEGFEGDKYALNNMGAVSGALRDLNESIANREKDRQLNEAKRKVDKIISEIDDELDAHKTRLTRVLQKNYVLKSDLPLNDDLCDLTQKYIDAKREEKNIADSSFASDNFNHASGKQMLKQITDLYEYEKKDAENYYNEQTEKLRVARDEALAEALGKKDADLKNASIMLSEIDDIRNNIEIHQSSAEESFEKNKELLLAEQKRAVQKLRSKADDEVDELSKKKLLLTRERKEQLEALETKIANLINDTKHQINEYLNKSSDYEIGNKDYSSVSSLPEQICVGEFTTKIGDCELSRILYGQKQLGYKTPVMLDMRNTGNIIINAEDTYDTEETVYRIVCGLTMKYMEEFPLGSLKVHFINKSSHRWISKFKNPFMAKDDPVCKGLVTDSRSVHSELDAIDRYIGDSVMPLIEGEIDDLYDLYKIDKTQSFHLFVIRRGFAEIVENGNTETLALLENLMGDWGIKSGARFIIVNDYVANEHITPKAKQLFSELLSKGMIIDLKGESAFYGNSPISISCVEEDNAETFIENKCSQMADILKNKQGDKVSYEDIGFGEIVSDKYSPVLEIPIGVCGQHRFILPFSCGGNGVQNQGCFVMGRSRRGKSSVFHSLIINGSMKYSPDDLQFWILDFKDGASSSIYKTSGIPHIKLLSQNNRIGDAICLLKLLEKERVRRQELFKSAGEKAGGIIFNKLSDYNEYVDKHPNSGEHLGRIMVLMDEAQIMFKEGGESIDDDTINGIVKLIGDITSLAAVTGIYLVIIVQDLNEQGKSYLLVDNYINKIGARIVFSSPPAALESSTSSGDEFLELKSQIDSLPTGQAYARYMNGVKPQRVKMAFCDENNFQTYFDKIRKRYSDYEDNLLVIGESNPIWLDDVSKSTNAKFEDLIKKPRKYKDGRHTRYGFVYGEDCYSLMPTETVVSSDSQSTTVIAGSNSRMSESVFSSILSGVNELSLKDIHVCSKESDEIIDSTINKLHRNGNMNLYKAKEIDVMIETLYEEYLRRKLMLEDETFRDEPPVFAFIHNVNVMDKIETGVEIGKSLQKRDKKKKITPKTDVIDDRTSPYSIDDDEDDDYVDPDDLYVGLGNGDDDVFDNIASEVIVYGNSITDNYTNTTQDDDVDNEVDVEDDNDDFYDEVMSRIGEKPIAAVIEEMCRSGHTVNMFFVISVTGLTDHSLNSIFMEARNQIIFNTAPEDISFKKSGYVIEEMLSQINNVFKAAQGKNSDAVQSTAVSYVDGIISKVRPILH